MATAYIIEQHTGYQFEPLADGEFVSLEEAESAMTELETGLGWRNMRIVKETSEGNIVTSKQTVEYGATEKDDDYDR